MFIILFAVQDAFYAGSLRSLPEYKDAGGNFCDYVSSVVNVPDEQEQQKMTSSFCSSLSHVFKEMLDFSLFCSPTFLLITSSAFISFLGKSHNSLSSRHN